VTVRALCNEPVFRRSPISYLQTSAMHPRPSTKRARSPSPETDRISNAPHSTPSRPHKKRRARSTSAIPPPSPSFFTTSSTSGNQVRRLDITLFSFIADVFSSIWLAIRPLKPTVHHHVSLPSISLLAYPNSRMSEGPGLQRASTRYVWDLLRCA
jgi:hypothetical protein